LPPVSRSGALRGRTTAEGEKSVTHWENWSRDGEEEVDEQDEGGNGKGEEEREKGEREGRRKGRGKGRGERRKRRSVILLVPCLIIIL